MYGADEPIIHRSRDEYGEVVITEDILLRNLYFGNRNKQSSMYRNHTTILVLEYTKAMMMALLFNRHPQRILIVGMGGGSLIKFFLRHCPKSEIDVVELRPLVVTLSRAYFNVPEYHPRLKVFEADANFYVNELDKEYDLILIDAFDAEGPVATATQIEFVEKYMDKLRKNGLLCVNTWNRPEDNFPRNVLRLRENNANSIFSYQLGSKNSNALIFCFDGTQKLKPTTNIQRVMDSFRLETGICLSQYFTRMRKQNESIWKRWLLAS